MTYEYVCLIKQHLLWPTSQHKVVFFSTTRLTVHHFDLFMSSVQFFLHFQKKHIFLFSTYLVSKQQLNSFVSETSSSKIYALVAGEQPV